MISGSFQYIIQPDNMLSMQTLPLEKKDECNAMKSSFLRHAVSTAAYLTNKKGLFVHASSCIL